MPGHHDSKRLIFLAATLTALALAGGAGGSSGRYSGPKGRIAVEGNGYLSVINAGTGARREVAWIVESAPAWSSDGRALGYVADGALRWTSFPSGRQRVITGVGSKFSMGPSWSPRGGRLVFTLHGALAGTARLVVVGPDGRHRHVVDRSASSYQIPEWSPTGREIAYFRDSGDDSAIWTVHPDGRGRRVLRRGVLDYPGSLSWSPDGRRIAFVGRPGASGAGVAVLVANANGTRPRAVASVTTEFDEASIGSVRWSPAGGRIAFLRWVPDGVSDTSLCITDRRGVERVLIRDRFIDDLAWSPDGRWLAYLTEDPNTVWVVRADGSGRRRVSRLSEENEALAWRPTAGSR
jgi:dipeptidyl aminopeptidase/acylaminoacyl peptidase